MAEGNGITEEAATSNDPPKALEYRVRRLEDAVAAMQDTRLMEERVADRVSHKLARTATTNLRETAGVVVETGRRLLPVTIDAIRTAAGSPPQADQSHTALPPPARPAWFLLESYREFQAMLRMYLDPGYPVPWLTRVLPLGLLALILLSWIWLPGTSLLPGFVSVIYVKVVDLVLAFLLYKYLTREARRFLAYEASRYRQP